MFLSLIPVGLVWRQDVLPSACYHEKGLMLAGSLTTLAVTSYVLLVQSDSAYWIDNAEAEGLSGVILGTMLWLVLLNSLFMEIILFGHMDRHCWTEGFSGTLVAIIVFGFMVPMGTVLAVIGLAIGLAVVCFAIGLVGLVVYSLWHVVKSTFTCSLGMHTGDA